MQRMWKYIYYVDIIKLTFWHPRLFSPPGEVKQEGGGIFREGTPYQRRGSLQLWQFLVALLDDPGNAHFIAWTGRGMEFKLIEPEEVRLNLQHLFL